MTIRYVTVGWLPRTARQSYRLADLLGYQRIKPRHTIKGNRAQRGRQAGHGAGAPQRKPKAAAGLSARVTGLDRFPVSLAGATLNA